MDLRRGPHNSVPSPRNLAYRHATRRLRALEPNTKDVPPEIAPGEEQLYSFYVPGLQDGLHTIDVSQDIDVPQDNENKSVKNSHDFYVIGPRFQLPDGVINSFYPPQGHADRVEVLPSIVFTDPTLPWERQASANRPADFSRNRVPWLAVLLFTQEELRLSTSELAEVFGDAALQGPGKQGDTLSTTMLAGDVPKLRSTNTKPILYNKMADGEDAKANLIFVRPKLFTSLFAKYDADGQQVPNKVGDEERCYVSHHRFLAHLRHIRLDGTPAAGKTDSEDHVYSVVVGHRVGPLSIDKPTPVVAHLVNIEGVEAMSTAISEKFVALASLHSWEYSCLPPSSLDVESAFEHLGDGLNVLRPTLSKAERASLREAGPVGTRVDDRIQDGFSLLRYRIQTGEVTAAFFRSSFTPTAVKFPDEALWPSSTTGTKLQTLDQNVNVMDITYSAAWNLGKTLGLAHIDFAVALARVRRRIFDLGMQAAKKQVIEQRSKQLGVPSPYKTREEVLATLKESISKVASLTEGQAFLQKPNSMAHRWHRPEHPPLDLSYQGPEILAIVDDCFQNAAKKIAGSVEDPDVPYNEYNTPYSTDWMTVLRWVLDRYHLVDVPAHYLITDPSHLPPEGLRFFAIDQNWVRAMIDGGLSLANHLDQKDDRVRNAIKWAITWYLSTKLKPPELNYVPTIPSYGFYIRSELVTKFPDLIIDLDPPPSDAFPPVILRHEVVDRGTMLCLMREPPAEPEFQSLFLREPPHQQYFAAAAEITTDHVTLEYTRVYTIKPIPDKDHRVGIEYKSPRKTPDKGRSVFIWGDTNDIRCLNVENMAADYQQEVKKKYAELNHPEWYTDDTPNAAMMGIQLTEPEWQLEVALPTKDIFPDMFKDPEGLVQKLHSATDRSRLPSIRVAEPKSLSIIRSDPPPKFGNRQREAPIQHRYTPPHFRVPRVSLNLQPGPLPVSEKFASAPKFIYNVYPVGKKAGDPIPMTTLPQDLVFSIVYDSNAQNFQMTLLEIRIGLKAIPRLTDRYAGAGPSMLSNLRFNVLARLDTQGTTLVLSLKPRSTKGYVPVSKVKEMSFLLSGVVVRQYSSKQQIKIKAYETYGIEAPWEYDVICDTVPA